ncbi:MULTISPECIES: DUF2505 domain-containing protein [unclassified Isoptericola]|uniref:DUF2505 domain-containing protein n=1 Tax=unclassified Isoptericola TaxID=2623355 RepID=UPI002712BC8E|nr:MULTISPECIES: DUF2505 domain-containing protein [unclassified Isoptericola]MDO8145910.1 DUF2505 domain-containing protein [Isoptericola sp. 178]MDO8147761.1 DUF2505 domain-containing protein [Isoptericola sp. b515]
MQFTFSQPVPLPVESVVAHLCDEAFQAEKATRLAARDFAMTVDRRPDGVTVRTERHLPTVGLPEFVKALVRPVMVVAETERWDPPEGGSRRGAFEIDVDGAPVRFRGAVGVVPEGRGARLTFEGTLSSTVPLFRGRIEEASATLVRETMEVEAALLEELSRSGAVPSDR